MLRSGVHRGRLAAGLVIPEGWDGKRPISLYVSDANAGAPLVRAVVETALAERGSHPTRVRVESSVFGGGPESRLLMFHYTAPANLVMFSVIGCLVWSSGLVWLRRSGLAQRLLATPANSLELFCALAASPLQLLTLQAVFLLLSGWAVFEMDWGPLGATLLLTVALVCFGTALSLWAGTVFRSPEQALTLGPFLGMALGMLGGCWWPLELVPAPMRALAQAVPTTWAMEGYLDLVTRGRGLAEIAPKAGALLTLALVLAALAVRRLRRELMR
jgi:ABC-2 type transport system permease protein